jgi:hypothetical protein
MHVSQTGCPCQSLRLVQIIVGMVIVYFGAELLIESESAPLEEEMLTGIRVAAAAAGRIAAEADYDTAI